MKNNEGQSQEVTLAEMLNEFLNQNYEFRQNVITNVMQVSDIHQNNFRQLDERAKNSILFAARKALPEASISKTLVEEVTCREETPLWNPAQEYLLHLPAWDGHDRVSEVIARIPGMTAEAMYRFHIWFRAAVAHWLQLDMLHGNELVPVLIGSQGIGKTVYCKLLLPPQLRSYMMDHLNMSNKFDREMALTNNLLVNIDEIEQIKPSQHAELKHTLSRSTVNSRQIYGRALTERARYASFIATTNCPTPLNDPTGSRRFICINIPSGMAIDNSQPINYDQLYAQLVYEVVEQKSRYWLTSEEQLQLEQDNQPFYKMPDLTQMIDTCFHEPDNNTKAYMSMPQIVDTLQHHYPLLLITQSVKTQIGIRLKRLGYRKAEERRDCTHYYIAPRQVA